MKRFIAGIALVMSAIACAPEPTEPASTNLEGTWKANAHLYTLSNFRLEMIQEPKGIVSGWWYADGDGGGGGCPEGVPCKAFGHLIGRNTVSQVELELLGAGKFEGILKQDNSMRGIFAVNLSYDTITFSRTSTTPALNITSNQK